MTFRELGCNILFHSEGVILFSFRSCFWSASGSEDKSGRATFPSGDELRELVRQRIGSDASPSPPSSGKEGVVEEPSSSSRSEVDMEKVELPVRGVALRDLLRQRMGSDD